MGGGGLVLPPHTNINNEIIHIPYLGDWEVIGQEKRT